MKIIQMNKFLIFITVLVCLFTSCSNDLDDNTVVSQTSPTNIVSVQENVSGLTKINIPDGIASVSIYNFADNSFLGTAQVENGHIWMGSTNANMSVKLYGNSSNKAKARKAQITDLNYIGEAIVYKSEDNVLSIQAAESINSGYNSNDFISIFPAGKDNRNISAPVNSTNFTHEVLYTSDGNPFSVYPIYSNGWYDLTLGIFYYDENGDRHDIDFWSMLAVNWKTPYSQIIAYNSQQNNPGRPGGPNNNNSINYTVSKTENAQGYQITLPEHYVYGFYISSNDDSSAGTFYCYSAENKCKEQHSANIVDGNGINYLSFEDQDGGDWDINDLICYINPKIDIIPEVTPEKITEELNKINSVVIVPDSVDKIVHGVTPDSCDIEARYDGKGHDYVRIAKPLKNNEEIEIDLSELNQYCQQDDTRITAHDDVTVVYCKNDTTINCKYNNSKITITNTCTNDKYDKVKVCVVPIDKSDDDYSYQLRIDLYPKSEECFDDIVKHIETCEWDKLFIIKKQTNNYKTITL